MKNKIHYSPILILGFLLAFTLLLSPNSSAVENGTLISTQSLIINAETGEEICVANVVLDGNLNLTYSGTSEGCNGPVDCPEGQFKCTSYDGSTSVCCNSGTELCGTSEYGYGKSQAWCYPSDLPDPGDCPVGTTYCSRGQQGDSVACCPSGFTCKTYEGSAWCSPNSQNQCPPGKVFCSAGSKDNTCCLPPPKEKCVKDYGYSWCKADKDWCEGQGPGFKKCGFYCCGPNQVCRSNGMAPDSCSQKIGVPCPPGQEACTGTANDYPITICCNAGQCRPSMNGPPTCKDNQYNPPPQCPAEDQDSEFDVGQAVESCIYQGQLTGALEDFLVPTER